jgi:ribosomal protein L20
MSRPFREHSKSTLLKAAQTLYVEREAYARAMRRRWLVRVVAAGVAGLTMGLAVGLLVARMLLGA